MKYPKMGSTTIGETAATVGDHLESTNAIRLLGDATLTGGRTFFLRTMGAIMGTAATRPLGIGIADAAAAATIIFSATNPAVKYILHSTATIASAQAGQMYHVKFAEPGLKFSTECVVGLAGTVGGATQTCTGVLKLWGSGYEE